MVRFSIFLTVLALGLFAGRDYFVNLSFQDAKNIPEDVAICVEHTTQNKATSAAAQKTANEWGKKVNVFLYAPHQKPAYPTTQRFQKDTTSITQTGKDMFVKCQAISKQVKVARQSNQVIR
jgi:hypothetical protein